MGLDNKKKGLILMFMIPIFIFVSLYLVGAITEVFNWYMHYSAQTSAVLTGGSVSQFESDFTIMHCILNTITSTAGLIGAIILLIIFIVINLCIDSFQKLLPGKDSTKDDRGMNWTNSGAYGTAKIMDEKDILEKDRFGNSYYTITPVEKSEGYIVGMLDDNAKKVVSIAPDSPLNKNVAVFGSPGTGKSRGYVRSKILQAVKKGESLVITDPKGELYESMSEYLRDNGYIVKLYNLNMSMMSRSDSWDCMGEIFDPVTGEVSDARTTEFANILMLNTGTPGAKVDEFWFSGEMNLLKAVILYVGEKYKTEYTVQQVKLIKKLAKQAITNERELTELLERSEEFYTTINERKEIIDSLYNKLNISERERKVTNELQFGSLTCTIADVYGILTRPSAKNIEKVVELDEMFLKASGEFLPLGHPAQISYSIFKSNDKIRANFLQGLCIRLQLFQSASVRDITINKDIDLSLPGEVKCAYFCVISDRDTTMRPISSLFFSFLFKDLTDKADAVGPKNRLYVNMVLDEFVNLGIIPDFNVKIATVRSRKINIDIVFQAIGQLIILYQRDAAYSILSCCDTTVFLGCNDPDTAKFISDKAGESTIEVSSVKYNNSVMSPIRPLDDIGQTRGEGKRNIYTVQEAANIDNKKCLIFTRSKNVMELNKMDYSFHPKSKGLDDCKIAEYTLIRNKFKTNIDMMSTEAAENNKRRRLELEAELKSIKENTKPEFSPEALNDAIENAAAENKISRTKSRINSNSKQKEQVEEPIKNNVFEIIEDDESEPTYKFNKTNGHNKIQEEITQEEIDSDYSGKFEKNTRNKQSAVDKPKQTVNTQREEKERKDINKQNPKKQTKEQSNPKTDNRINDFEL